MKNQSGQIIILVAVLLMVILMIMAVIIDGARIYIEQQEIQRGLDAAGKAGLIVVGNQMVTQVVKAQTSSASITTSPTPSGATPRFTPTETPEPDDFFSWLSEEDCQTLVAPPLQTMVATHVLGSLRENGLGKDNPNVIDITISYPDSSQPGDRTLGILLELDRRVVIIFGGILNHKEGVISGRSRQTIPQH